MTDAAVPLRLAAVLGFLAVAVGAFGAHGLERRFAASRTPTWDPAARYETGSKYHFYHTLAVAALAVLPPGRARTAAMVAFAAGVLLFSGSLYLLAVTGTRWLGAVTPLGGVAFLAGWVATFVAAAGRPH